LAPAMWRLDLRHAPWILHWNAGLVLAGRSSGTMSHDGQRLAISPARAIRARESVGACASRGCQQRRTANQSEGDRCVGFTTIRAGASSGELAGDSIQKGKLLSGFGDSGNLGRRAGPALPGVSRLATRPGLFRKSPEPSTAEFGSTQMPRDPTDSGCRNLQSGCNRCRCNPERDY